MKRLFIFLIASGVIIFFLFYSNQTAISLRKTNEAENSKAEKKFANDISLSALFEKKFDGRDLIIGAILAENESYTRHYITYMSGALKISGILNIPKGKGPFPVLILNHGFIDPAVYTNGRGLKREQDYLARRGYIVLHPDYRNHADSDKDPEADVKFRLGYVEDAINSIFAVQNSDNPIFDKEAIGILGHSMGGGVAENIMVIRPDLAKAYVLFAPVSMDARDTYNRWMTRRPETAPKIIELYGSPDENPEFWNAISTKSFVERITAPILIHHGTADQDVPLEWSERTVELLKNAGKDITFYTYPNESHEFIDAWPFVMWHTGQFFDIHLKKNKTASVFCSGNNANDFDCYERYYEELVAREDVRAAFADLKSRYNSNSYVKSQCYPLTHVIGRKAAQKFLHVADAFVQGDGFCWSGYYHGVMEGVVGHVGIKNLATALDDICSGIPGKEKYSFDYYNCVHGLGHGIMALTQDELFDALSYCGNLTGAWEQQSCAGGVYMENIIIDGINHKTKYLRRDDPHYPCNASPDEYKNSCYLMQTSYMLTINGGDFKKTFEWCGEAQIPFRNTCYQSLGRDISGRSLSNPEVTKNNCLLGFTKEQQLGCIVGAVKDFISYFHSDTEAQKLCASFEEEMKQTCLETAKTYYANF